MKKEIINFAVVIVCVLLFIPCIGVEAGSYGEISEQVFINKINSLRNTFVHGQYWNEYNGFEHTGTKKCPESNSTCPGGCTCKCGQFYYNGIWVAGQCHAYALKLGNIIFGGNPNTWTKIYNANSVYAGDIARINNDGHSIFIYKVEGDTIYYTDCNYTGPCKVNWNGSMSKQTLKNKLSWIYHLSGNTLTGAGNSLGSPIYVGEDFYTNIVKADAGKMVAYDKVCNVFLQTDYKATHQVWHFEHLDDGSYKITNLYDGKALEIQYESKECNANIEAGDYWGGNHQRWYVYGEAGQYKLKAKNTEYVMDVVSNGNNDGTNIATYTFNNSGAQKFHFAWVDLKPATLKVNTGSSKSLTTFTWNEVAYTDMYDVKIWKDKCWQNDPYNIKWDAKNNTYSIQLPIGHYEAYVDTRHGQKIDMSNIVSFDIKDPTYTVTFNVQGGKTPTASKTVTYNSTYGTLPTPTNPGYTFNGWYTATSGGTKITSDTKVTLTSNQTLYARWTQNKPTVTLKSDKTKLVLGESITFTFSQTGAAEEWLCIEKDGSRVETFNVLGKTSYTYTPKTSGTFTAFHSAKNSGGYIETERITYTVSNPTNTQPFVSVISKADNKISVSVTRKTDVSYPIVIVAAQYDSSNQLVGIKLENIDDSNSKSEYNILSPIAGGAKKVKAFVWNKNTHKPLAEVKESVIK